MSGTRGSEEFEERSPGVRQEGSPGRGLGEGTETHWGSRGTQGEVGVSHVGRRRTSGGGTLG